MHFLIKHIENSLFYDILYPVRHHNKGVVRIMHESVLRRFVPQLCTKTPDKQIQNVESTSFTRKKSTNLNVRINPDLSIDQP